VDVDRDGKEVTLRPKQLVFATGMSSRPSEPLFKGMERFEGEQHHSARHPGPDGFKRRKVVVIGSNNSAHDICAALYEAGVDATMVQRSSTHIVRSDTLMVIGIGDLYSERAVRGGMTTAKADLIFASLPYRILGGDAYCVVPGWSKYGILPRMSRRGGGCDGTSDGQGAIAHGFPSGVSGRGELRVVPV